MFLFAFCNFQHGDIDQSQYGMISKGCPLDLLLHNSVRMMLHLAPLQPYDEVSVLCKIGAVRAVACQGEPPSH